MEQRQFSRCSLRLQNRGLFFFRHENECGGVCVDAMLPILGEGYDDSCVGKRYNVFDLNAACLR